MSDQFSLFAETPFGPDGLRYAADFVTPAEEHELITKVASLPLVPFQFGQYEGKRRVVSFGFGYDYTARRLVEAERIPDWLADIAHRLEAFGRPGTRVQQVLCAENDVGVEIGWHRDKPHFDQIFGLSLGAACKLRFRRPAASRFERFTLEAAPRSIYLMSGEARSAWEHSIPAVEARRYSVTFPAGAPERGIGYRRLMAKRTGSADLPLHGGRVPPWLAMRMSSLGAIVTQAIVHHYGRDEFLRRLSHPFWFQSFGAVMGMDWHSSGITTSVIGALKRGLGPLQDELGIHVCGGRGQHSRKTPDELRALGDRIGFDGAALTRASRLVAKVDSAAVQDGFDLYLHGFFVTDEGRWTVVQQGMNGDRKQARRYHWHSEAVTSFVDEPHSAIDGPSQGEVVNLTDRRAGSSRSAQLDLLAALGPDGIVDEFAALTGSRPLQPLLPHLVMPAHHDVRSSDVFTRRLHGTLAAAAERGPVDFQELLLTPGVGARTVRSLAMVAEVVHGAPYRFRDPARFPLAHGGKDRHPYPVPIKVYDETIRVLKSAVQNAKLGRDEELQILKRLDDQARRLERTANGPSFEDFVDGELRASASLGARSVFGWEEKRSDPLAAAK